MILYLGNHQICKVTLGTDNILDITSKNKTDGKDIFALATNNYWISTTGTISGADTNWVSTSKIRSQAGDTLKYALLGHTSVGSIICYDINGNIVDCVVYSGPNTQGLFSGTYTLPANTEFITITGCSAVYNPTNYPKQYVVSYPNTSSPQYVKSGLKLWCDGYNNTGYAHSTTTTTWTNLVDDTIGLYNASSEYATEPSSTLQGSWNSDGFVVNKSSNHYMIGSTYYSLGSDRTLEVCATLLDDSYSTLGFKLGDRFKLRKSSGNWWARVSSSDSTDLVNIQSGQPTIYDSPVTYSISRCYDSVNDTTIFKIYCNGVYLRSTTLEGNYRGDATARLLFDQEGGSTIIHSVRLYGRALTDDEIRSNYTCDNYRFSMSKEYQAVDYIESNGTQYIDSGIPASTSLITEVKCQSFVGNKCVVGMGTTSSQRYQIYANTNLIYSALIAGTAVSLGTVPITEMSTIKLDPVAKKVSINGTEYDIPWEGTIQNRSLWLFGRNQTTSPNNYLSTMRMWYCKMWDGATMVRNFVPCYRKSDNEVGLYDLVSNTFFVNNGTGTFIMPV